MAPPDYDVNSNFGTLLDKHRQLPFKHLMDLINAKADDLLEWLDRPLPYDQGPGKEIPYSMPAWFGPLPLTTAGRNVHLQNQDGQLTLAALAQPSLFSIPTNGDLWVNREHTFRAEAVAAFGFVNWGYTSAPGAFNVPYTNPNGVGDILSPVGPDPSKGPNGGAMPLDYFGGTFATFSTPQPDLPNISFDVEVYDKLRGRRMHEGKIPSSLFSGGRIANRALPSPLIFRKGGKYEPRIYVNEIRMGSVLNTATVFNAASVKVWVCLVFKGVAQLEVP